MANPNSRQTLIDYSLRRLGEPVIEINVDEDQLEDRLDEALQYFQEYHSDASKRVYVKHTITADDITNGYVPVDTNIIFVRRMVPMGGSGSQGWMGLEFQMRQGDFALMGTYGLGSMSYYHQMKSHLSMIDMTLNGLPQTEFVQAEGRLYIHGEFETESIQLGDIIVIEGIQLVNPATHASIYNDMFLKELTTALIKLQWGSNLIKFEGMQLPGGVTLNGRQIYDDANTEVIKIKEDIRLEHELPIDFIIG